MSLFGDSTVNTMKAGWVFKESRFLGTWRKRWMILEGTTLCTYVEKPSASESGGLPKPSESFAIANASCFASSAKRSHPSGTHLFVVHTVDSRVVYLATQRSSDQSEWLKSIKWAARGGNKDEDEEEEDDEDEEEQEEDDDDNGDDDYDEDDVEEGASISKRAAAKMTPSQRNRCVAQYREKLLANQSEAQQLRKSLIALTSVDASSRTGYLRMLHEEIGPPPERTWESEWDAMNKERCKLAGRTDISYPKLEGMIKMAQANVTEMLSLTNRGEAHWTREEAEMYWCLQALGSPMSKAISDKSARYAASTYAFSDLIYSHLRRMKFYSGEGAPPLPRPMYCNLRGLYSLVAKDPNWARIEEPDVNGFRGLTTTAPLNVGCNEAMFDPEGKGVRSAKRDNEGNLEWLVQVCLSPASASPPRLPCVYPASTPHLPAGFGHRDVRVGADRRTRRARAPHAQPRRGARRLPTQRALPAEARRDGRILPLRPRQIEGQAREPSTHRPPAPQPAPSQLPLRSISACW